MRGVAPDVLPVPAVLSADKPRIGLQLAGARRTAYGSIGG